jgi:hypothetical protein
MSQCAVARYRMLRSSQSCTCKDFVCAIWYWLAALVRLAAQDAGAAFVDLFALTDALHDPPRFLSRDRFYPSDAGMRCWQTR